MTLDGVNLYTTHKWRLAWVEDYLDQPQRKKILREQAYTSDDLKYEAVKVTVTLIQQFATKALMYAGINNIYTLLSGTAVHTVVITEHSIPSFRAVVRDGVKTKMWNTMAEMTITFTITTI